MKNKKLWYRKEVTNYTFVNEKPGYIPDPEMFLDPKLFTPISKELVTSVDLRAGWTISFLCDFKEK